MANIVTECNHFVAPPDINETDVSNINVLESFPVLEGLNRWKDTFRGHRVSLVIDNISKFITWSELGEV